MIKHHFWHSTVLVYIAKLLLIAGLVLMAVDVNAVDGNYSSPYGSQFDTRSTTASLSNAALLGLLLVALNSLAAIFYSLRYRLNKSR